MLEPGIPAPSLVVDLLESDRRLLASERDLRLERLRNGGVRLHDTGQYERWLGPGTYVVDINHLRDFTGGDVPRTITMETGETVELEINIDTTPR
ncbi:MAG: hypothetical protein ACE5IG_05405 [Dehalococcoidia bacterium]